MKYTFFILLVSLFTLAGHGQDKVDTAKYARCIFYRAFIPWANAPLKKVPVYINDTLLHQLKANNIFTKNIYSSGRVKIAIDEKKETTVLVTIATDSVYYFKCEVVPGLWFGLPTVQRVPAEIGKAECEILEAKKRK